jgi:hypothetical protein
VPTAFFLYLVRGAVVREEFEQRILGDVAPRALAEETVESWRLHRTTGWAGGSDDAPDCICFVEVADLDLWSMEASASISETRAPVVGIPGAG